MKNLTLALMITAAVAAASTIATASPQGEVYTCDSYTLILREQASYNAPIILSVDDAYGYELDVMYCQGDFGYCYVPAYGETGWVDLDDMFYVGEDDYQVDYRYTDYNYGYDSYDYDYDYGFDGYDELRYSLVESGFLALRYDPSYNDANIIARIYDNGTALYMTGEFCGNYGYCYVPAFEMYGWVDLRYTY